MTTLITTNSGRKTSLSYENSPKTTTQTLKRKTLIEYYDFSKADIAQQELLSNSNVVFGAESSATQITVTPFVSETVLEIATNKLTSINHYVASIATFNQNVFFQTGLEPTEVTNTIQGEPYLVYLTNPETREVTVYCWEP